MGEKNGLQRYRVEFRVVGVEDAYHGKEEFEAETDESAVILAKDICQREQAGINSKIENRFWHWTVHLQKLIKIERPEISEEVKF